ncbi:hypothetical protein [Paraflavitalea sp. CAU 1676]|uniref:hypothetical protein n=1 Tax=Paraflavitalea sp. CAU 1676 TaxID=3032598 RepID=UPI0023DA5C69|nr:hypothetical protein [Paraflavitalea sp. CAU 1676]MDF2188530.1 hypothetical protein [Paraflavitalea sp. CAU 1676]
MRVTIFLFFVTHAGAMKKLITIFWIVFYLDGFGQTDSVAFNFSRLVMEVEGDLNKDSLSDKVVVTQDTLHENAPYQLQVFFKEPGGQWELIVSSLKLIEAQYPNGRDAYITGDGFSHVAITNGVLSVYVELLRGHYEHKFRYQHGCFDLIGFSMSFSDGRGVVTTTDFNLLTGVRIERSERYDITKILSNKKRKILIRPLPKLQDVVPIENDLY